MSLWGKIEGMTVKGSGCTLLLMEENRDVLCVGSQRRPSACFGAACRENGRRGCSGGEVSAPCKKWVRTEKQALLILSGWDAPIVVKEEER